MPELSIVMPCLNESKTLESCIIKCLKYLADHNIAGEVIIADNGSTDNSVAIAKRLGVKVIEVPIKGYGSALNAGLLAAENEYIIMGDADDTYDFTNLGMFIERLDEGYDLVVGNRLKGNIEPGAMPLLHRYFGTPMITFIGNCLFRTPIGDYNGGLRAIRKASYTRLNLSTIGMSFASEMIIKASLAHLKMAEVEVAYSRSVKGRRPNLKTWQDGLDHLRVILQTWLMRKSSRFS